MTRETNRRKRLRPLLVFPLLLAGIFAGWIWRGNRSVQRTDFTIPTGLPISEFRIAHISDLHNTEFGKENTALLALLQEAAPALIAVTGDLVDSRHTDLDTAAAFMEAAAEIAPVYYVTGNHEARLESYPALEKRLADAGVTVLRIFRIQAAFLTKAPQPQTPFWRRCWEKPAMLIPSCSPTGRS